MPRAFRMFCLLVLTTGPVLFSPRASAQQTSSALTQASAPAPAPITTPTPVDGASAQSWVKFGISNGVRGDLDAAISDFNQAIKIDPNFAPAYQCRGHALFLQDKLDEAITDYSKAIELDPKYKDPYYDRGVIHGEKGEFELALGDFNKAIELDPQYSSAYYNRGHVKYFMGDLDGALPDLNQAISLDANPPFSYFIRGLIRLARDDREGAASDFQQSATNGYPDAAFWLWIVQTENGERGEARGSLTKFLSKPELFKPDDWPMQIGNFLLEENTQDQLMAKAKEDRAAPDHLCEAWFYCGMVRRFSGDNKGALDCFQQAIATGAKVSEMYLEAQREATSLQKS